MGIYFSKYSNPCPSCGTVAVSQTFLSVTMSVWRQCGACGKNDFSDEEVQALGEHTAIDAFGNEVPKASWSDWTRRSSTSE